MGKVVSLDEFRARRHPLISTAELADLLNDMTGNTWWTAKKIRRVLQPRGALVNVKTPGGKQGRWYTTLDRIRRALPEQWEEVQRSLAVIEDE